jgi:hypothetical protein
LICDRSCVFFLECSVACFCCDLLQNLNLIEKDVYQNKKLDQTLKNDLYFSLVWEIFHFSPMFYCTPIGKTHNFSNLYKDTTLCSHCPNWLRKIYQITFWIEIFFNLDLQKNIRWYLESYEKQKWNFSSDQDTGNSNDGRLIQLNRIQVTQMMEGLYS